jgi:hypothetical protein
MSHWLSGSALLPQVNLPPALTRTTLLDLSGYSELGVTTYLPDMTIPNTLETGKTTLAYAADNWVHRGDTNDQKKDTFNVYRAIKDVVAAERGRFFFDRTGQAIFWGGRIRTFEWWIQSPLPCRLATPQFPSSIANQAIQIKRDLVGRDVRTVIYRHILLSSG